MSLGGLDESLYVVSFEYKECVDAYSGEWKWLWSASDAMSWNEAIVFRNEFIAEPLYRKVEIYEYRLVKRKVKL